jgi:hypothetical protein
MCVCKCAHNLNMHTSITRHEVRDLTDMNHQTRALPTRGTCCTICSHLFFWLEFLPCQFLVCGRNGRENSKMLYTYTHIQIEEIGIDEAVEQT